MQRCDRCAREFAPGMRPDCTDPLCPHTVDADATINEMEVDRAALLRAAAAMRPEDGDTVMDGGEFDSTRQYDDAKDDPDIKLLADRLRQKFVPLRKTVESALPDAESGGGDATLTSERPKDLAALFAQARSTPSPENEEATVEFAALRRGAAGAPAEQELDIDPLAMTDKNQFDPQDLGQARAVEGDDYDEDEVDRTAPMTAAEIGLDFAAHRPELPVPPPRVTSAPPIRPGLPALPVVDRTEQIGDDDLLEASQPQLGTPASAQPLVRDFVPPLYEPADQSVEQLKAMSPGTVEQAMRQARGQQPPPHWAGNPGPGAPPPWGNSPAHSPYSSGTYPPNPYGPPHAGGPGEGFPSHPGYPGAMPSYQAGPEGSYMGPPPAAPAPGKPSIPWDKVIGLVIVVLAIIAAVLVAIAVALG